MGAPHGERLGQGGDAVVERRSGVRALTAGELSHRDSGEGRGAGAGAMVLLPYISPPMLMFRTKS